MPDLESIGKEAQAIATREDVGLLAKEAQEIKVLDLEGLGKAGDILKTLKVKINWLKDECKKFTAPLDDVKAKIKAQFDPKISLLTQIKEGLDRKMYNFQVEERRRQEAAERKRREDEQKALEKYKADVMDAAVESNDENLVKAAEEIEHEQQQLKVEPVKVQVKASGSTSKVTYRDCWKFEVVNEALVPVDLKTTDRAKVTEKIKAGAREIAGLRIYNEPVSVSR